MFGEFSPKLRQVGFPTNIQNVDAPASGVASTSNNGGLTVKARTGGQSGTTGIAVGGTLILSGGIPGASGNGAGGGVTINGTVGNGAGQGGSFAVTCGNGGPSGGGGSITMNAGNAGATGNTGGNINITAGSAVTGAQAGNLTVQAGNSGSANGVPGGNAILLGGIGSGSNTMGGEARVLGGDSQGAGGDAGTVLIKGGTVFTSGNGGTITITGSNGVGTNKTGGNININIGGGTGSGTDGAVIIASTATPISATKAVVQINNQTAATSGIKFQEFLTDTAPGTVRGSITYNGTVVVYNTSSDIRLKQNISASSSAGTLIDSIQIRSFDWKETGTHTDFGVIAQELITVFPDAVSSGDNDPTTITDVWGVDSSTLVWALIKEIQDLRVRVAQLENT